MGLGEKKKRGGPYDKVISLFLLCIVLLLFVSFSIHLFHREKDSKKVDQFCHLKCEGKERFWSGLF